MRLSRLTAVVAVLVPLFVSTTSTAAQEPIRVVRHQPADTARSGDVITISFDRPVAGSFERSARPERFITIEPKLASKIEWRDPVTLRVTPSAPLAPGSRYRITVDKRLTGVDGGRLAEAYRFTIVTLGPRLLQSVPALSLGRDPTPLLATGRLSLVYTAPVDSAAFSRTARLELASDSECGAQVIRYAVREQRPLADNDPMAAAYRYDDESLDRRYRRVVELWPERTPPDGCRGEVVLPSLDPFDRPEIRYGTVTAPTFRLLALECAQHDCVRQSAMVLGFTAPVSRQNIVDAIHVDPAVPFTIDEFDGASPAVTIRLPMASRETYRVRVDSSVTDIFGRRITASRERSLTVPDRGAAIGHQLGFFTVPRHRPVIRLTHINVDSAEIAFIPVPDSLRRIVMSDVAAAARAVAGLRDTTKVALRLNDEANKQHITEIPIPSSLLARRPNVLVAVRARSFGRKPPPLTYTEPVKGQPLPEIRIVAISGGPSDSRLVAIVQVTDLVVHTRVADGWGAVFVTDMNSGLPVVGARATVLDDQDSTIALGVSDNSGVAVLQRLPQWRPRPATRRSGEWYSSWTQGNARRVEVTLGDDRAFINVSTAGAVMPPDDWGDADYGYDRSRFVRAMLFADRAIYRPGEMVYIKGIVRQGWLNDLRLPPGTDSVRIKVAATENASSQPEIVRDTVVRLTEFGTVTDSFRIARGGSLGEYMAVLDVVVSGHWQTVTEAGFRVAEYRAPEFSVTLALDSGITYLGDTISAQTSARYYFDAPMAGAIVRWRAVTSEREEALVVPGLPDGFVIGDRYDYEGRPDRESDIASGTATLDRSGQLRLRIPTRVAATTGPADVVVEIAIDDVNRQSVAARQSRVAHAASFYVAARSVGARWYWRQGEPQSVQVIAVRPDGRRVPSVSVTIAVVRQRFAPTWRDDVPYRIDRWVNDTVHRGAITTTDSVTTFEFTPEASGSYHLVFTAADERNRSLTTTLGAYVVPRTLAGWGGRDETGLSMHLARDTVRVGDTLEVAFLSPFERSEGWVTVEREGIIAQRRLTVVSGENTIRLPVTPEFLPGGDVTITLVDRVAAWKVDSVHQRIRSSAAKFSVDLAPKTLHVRATSLAERYGSGDSARVSVRVTANDGRPARGEITLWAVDEAVLALAEYERPDPVAAMYRRRSGGLRFATSLRSLASREPMLTPVGWVVRGQNSLGSQMSVVSTGTGVAAPPSLRSNFRTTAFYVASLPTDSAGLATATLKLPDNLTTYRLFMIAVGANDRFGSGETTFVVTRPVIARAAMPRFVRSGDAFTAGAVVNNRTAKTMDARVLATGATGRAERRTATRTLAEGGGVEVRFPWRIDQQPGDTAVFRFDVEGGAHRDAVRVTLPVRAPYSPRFHTLAGIAQGSSIIRMPLPAGLDPVRSRVTLRVGTTPVPAVQAAFARLDVYPYACTEQITSMGRGVIAMLRLQQAGLVDSTVAPTAATLRSKLQMIVDELSRRQHASGEIAYWSYGSWTSEWLTASAGMLLIDARGMGAAVRPAVLERITESLRARHDTLPVAIDSVHGTRADRARVLERRLSSRLSQLIGLRSLGAPDSAGEARLLEHEREMVWEDRVWLAELLGMRPDRSLGRGVLARAWRDVELAGARVDIPDSLLRSAGQFPSRVRPVGRLLSATMTIEPEHPKLGLLVERVVRQSVRSFSLWNTQDYVMAAEVLARVAVWQKSGNTSAISVSSARSGQGGRPLFQSAASESSSPSLPLEGLIERDAQGSSLPLRIASGREPVFYVVSVDEVPLEAPTTPDAQGMIVERWYERFSDGRPITEVKEGELVRGRLRITVPSTREFVAVEDMLPAGLEVLDLSLRTTPSVGPFVSETAVQADEAYDGSVQPYFKWLYGSWADGWWSPWEHKELRDDRVVYFARTLWKGSYTATYVARATTAGTFVRPPAHAVEMYNPSLGGRSDGGVFKVVPRK